MRAAQSKINWKKIRPRREWRVRNENELLMHAGDRFRSLSHYYKICRVKKVRENFPLPEKYRWCPPSNRRKDIEKLIRFALTFFSLARILIYFWFRDQPPPRCRCFLMNEKKKIVTKAHPKTAGSKLIRNLWELLNGSSILYPTNTQRRTRNS